MQKTYQVVRHSEDEGEDFLVRIVAKDTVQDVGKAVAEAANEYLSTREGFDLLSKIGGQFTWNYVQCIPQHICRKHGIRILWEGADCDLCVDRYTNIVPDPTFHVFGIKWDTDGAKIPDLPKSLDIPVSKLLEDGEEVNDLEYYEVIDRISDWLSDEYGFCHDGFSVKGAANEY